MAEITFDIDFNPKREKIDKFITVLKKALKSVGADVGGLDGFVEDLGKVEQGASKSGKKLKEMEERTRGVAKVGGGLAKIFTFNQISQGITTATAALNQFTQPFIELDTQVKNIGTLGVKNFQEFSQLSLELSKTVPKSAADIAGATYQAISAGLVGTNKEINEFVGQAAKVATAGLATTEDAVNGLTTVMNAYKLGVQDTGQVSDTFFAAIKLGKTSFNEMNAALANMVPVGSAVGVGFDELSASVAQMTSLGVPTSQASTQIRQAMIELQKPSKELAEAMDVAGLSVANIGDTLKNQGLIATLQQLEESAAESGKSLTQVFSSSEAASAGLLLTGANAESATAKLKGVREEIEKGASTEAYNVAAESIANKTQIIANKIQAFFGGVFETLGSGALVAVNTLNQVGPALAGLGGLGAIIPDGSLGNIKKLGTSILTFLVPSLATASTTSGIASISFSSMWTALTGPVGLAVAGIAAVTAGLVYFFSSTDDGKKMWSDFGDFFSKLWDDLVKVVGEVWDEWKPVFSAMGDALSEFGAIALNVGSFIISALIAPFEVLWATVSIGAEIVSSIISTFFEWIGVTESSVSVTDLLTNAINNITKGLKIAKYITAGVTSAFTAIKTVFTDVVKAFRENSLYDAIKASINIFGTVGERAKEGFKEGFKNARFGDIVEKAFEPLNKSIKDISSKTSETIEKELGETKPDFKSIISSLQSSQAKQLQAVATHKAKELSKHGLTEQNKALLTEKYAKIQEEIIRKSSEKIAEFQAKANKESGVKPTAKTPTIKSTGNTSAKEDALAIVKLKKEELAHELDIFKINQEIVRVEAGRSKTSADELAEQNKLIANMQEYRESLNKAIDDGFVLSQSGTKVTIDKAKFESEIDNLNAEIALKEKDVELLAVHIGIDKSEMEAELKQLERENLELDIKLGFKSDEDLLSAYQDDRKALEEELKNTNLSPIDRKKIESELKKLEIDLIALQENVNEQVAQSQIRSIKNAGQREYAQKKLDLDKWLKSELDEHKGNDDAKLQIQKEYQDKKNDLFLENEKKTGSILGVSLTMTEAIFDAFNKPVNTERADEIQREIDLLNEKEGNELNALKSGEISYNEYVDRLNDIDQERANKEKALKEEGSGFWATINDGIVAGAQDSMSIYAKEMREAQKDVASNFNSDTTSMSDAWDNSMGALGESAKAGAKMAGAQFVTLLAKGESVLGSAKKAVLGTALEMLDSQIKIMTPQIMMSASALLGPIAGPIAAGAMLAIISGLSAKAKSAISKHTGGEMLGVGGAGGVVRSRQLYEVAEHGTEFIFNATTYRNNEEYVNRMHAGENFEDIVNRDFIPKAIAAERILQEKSIAQEQSKLNYHLALQNQKMDILIEETRKTHRTFKHRTETQVAGELTVTGDSLTAILENQNRGFVE